MIRHYTVTYRATGSKIPVIATKRLYALAAVASLTLDAHVSTKEEVEEFKRSGLNPVMAIKRRH